MSIEVIKAPSPRYGNSDNVRVFLAGSIDMGAATDWQSKLIAHAGCSFDENDNITFYNPRRTGGFSGEQTLEDDDFAAQVNWEIDRIDRANIVVFYITAESWAPITLWELGYFLGKQEALKDIADCNQRQRIVIGVEQGFWRRGNIEVMCDRLGILLVDNLIDVAYALEQQVADVNKIIFV